MTIYETRYVSGFLSDRESNKYTKQRFIAIRKEKKKKKERWHSNCTLPVYFCKANINVKIIMIFFIFTCSNLENINKRI